MGGGGYLGKIHFKMDPLKKREKELTTSRLSTLSKPQPFPSLLSSKPV